MSTITSTITDKLPKLPAAIDLDEAKKPLFAAVGVVDLSVEQLKDVPAEAKKLQEKVQAKVEAARTARAAQLKTVPAQLKTVPAQAEARAKELRSEVETRVAKAQATATGYYGKLAVRGEKLVTQIRRQPATEAAIAEGKAAVKKAIDGNKAAATSAKKATKAAGTATEGAAEKLG
ncbi:MAG: hypothetical protein WCD35_10280 [Mycobacteriales bacterium]